MSIPLGLAGTGAAWTAATREFGLPAAVGEALWAASALGWLTLLIARVPVTRGRWWAFHAEIHHPVSGPFPAYVPVIALLLTAHYAPLLPPLVAEIACWTWIGMLTMMCGYLIAIWITGPLQLDHLHPGYALPVIAGPFIASGTLTAVGYSTAALMAIGAGAFFWLVIGTIIMGRLMVARSLPGALSPTLAVLVTPPITAGLAWFAYSGGGVDEVQYLLLGVLVLLMTAQVFLIPVYLRAPYSSTWWAFSFPAGALAGYSIHWHAVSETVVSAVTSITALSVATLTLLALIATSAFRAARAGAARPRPGNPE